jgi:signal transduction histidine kinase
MTLLDCLPREKLEKLVNRRCDLLGMAVCVLDTDRNPLAGTKEILGTEHVSQVLTLSGQQVGYLLACPGADRTEEEIRHALLYLQEQIQDAVRTGSEIDGLSAEIVHSYRILNAVYELSRRLGAVVDIPTACRICLEETLEGIHADRAILALRSGDAKQWSIGGEHGAKGTRGAGQPFTDEGMDAAAAKGEAFLADAREHLPAGLAALAQSTLVGFPMMWAPLRVQRDTIGFILLSRCSPEDPFLTDDMKLLQTLATCAATVIQNVRLVADLQHSLEELRERSEIIKEMQADMMYSQKMSALGQLSAAVVHDIKNPLTVISAYAQLLKESQTAAEASQFADSILEATKQVSEIIARVLDFFRQKPPERRIENINEIIDDLLIFAEYYLSKAKMVEVRRVLHRDLPTVLVDRGQIQDVFFNIIMNACHAMEKGGTLTIRTEMAQLDDETPAISVSFTDTGCGIPKDQLDSIFKPFVTTRRRGEGTGLGLAICQRVVRDHGGRILVESEVGTGTTFRIVLPKHFLPSTQPMDRD